MGVGQWGSFESMSSGQHLTSKAVLTARRTTRNVSHGEWCLLQTKREGSRQKIRWWWVFFSGGKWKKGAFAIGKGQNIAMVG